MTRSTDTRNRPPELVALCQAALHPEAEQLTHIRMPIFVHLELCQLIKCARKLHGRHR